MFEVDMVFLKYISDGQRQWCTLLLFWPTGRLFLHIQVNNMPMPIEDKE